LQKELSLMQKNSQVLGQKQQNMRLYSEQDVPLILQLITVAAKENNVQIMQINPFKEKATVVKEKKTKKDKDAPKQKVAEQQFIALGFELSINAAYHDVGAFLHQLQNSGQPIFAESYTMAAQADPLKQKLELTLKTHVKK
jgi:DNA-binding transcriptional MerR regulator